MPVSISGAGSISGLDQGFNVTTGSVGIGTDNPSHELDIESVSPTIELKDSDHNYKFQLTQSGSATYVDFDTDGGGSSSLRIRNAYDEKVRIQSDGKVGIRTDAPKQVLSVVGRANFDLQGDYYGAWINGDSQGSSSFNVGAWHNAGGRMRNEASHLVLETMNTSHWIQLQPSGGNISVGSNNPNGLLALTASSGRILTLRNSTTGSASGDGSYLALNGSDFQIANAETANVILYTSDTERLRITSDGKIGVNDISPASLFTVNNGTNDDHCFLIKNDNVGAYFGTYGTGHGSYPREVTINATRIDSGSSPFLRIGGQGGIKFCVDFNTERLRIQPSGYVGIGEESPGGKLTVKHANTATSGLNATLKLKQGVATNGNRSSLIFSSLDDFDVAAVNGVIEVHAGTSSNNAGRLEFWTKAQGSNAAERLRISSDGKVCVGTTLTNYGVLQIRDASGDSTTSAIQVENASSGNSTTNVILRSVSLNSGAWANAEYRAKGHVFSHQTSPVLTVLPNFGPWAEGNKGTTRGTLHLRPDSTDHMGGAITFGASDRDSGDTAMAGIYTRSDGTYGTKMYFATTNSYSAGPKNAMFIDEHGYIHDSNRPYIYGSPTNTNGSGIANSMHVFSSRNLSFSNSRITVPVSGVYHICFNTICDDGTGRIDAHIYVNGGTRVQSLNDTNTSGYHYRGMSISLMLSANDYIQFNNNDWYDATSTGQQYWRTASVVFLG